MNVKFLDYKSRALFSNNLAWNLWIRQIHEMLITPGKIKEKTMKSQNVRKSCSKLSSFELAQFQSWPKVSIGTAGTVTKLLWLSNSVQMPKITSSIKIASRYEIPINQQKFQILCDNWVSNFLPSALQSICNKNRPTFISILPNLIEILQGKIVSLKMYKW